MLFKFRYRGKAQVRLALRGSHRYRPQEYCRPRFATEAGLTPVEIFDVDSPFIYPHEATAVRGLNSSGVAARAIENSSEQAVTQAHAKAIAPFRQPDGSYRIKADGSSGSEADVGEPCPARLLLP